MELAIWIYLQVGKFLGANVSADPFPLDHGDWNDQNVLIDDDYRVVGMLDWELTRTCSHEYVKASKLFQYTLRDITDSILVLVL
jgi:RIO-like serine/threonine protein kinase